jgi:ABC-type amino acid transport substrate-binding protein
MADETIEIDLDGKVVGVPRDVVGALAAAAAARAHASGRHRDLSLQLAQALESGRVSLGQNEIRALCAVLEEEHPDRFGPAAAELLRAVA